MSLSTPSATSNSETPDINDMFNFDDFGTDVESGNESNSPATVSPNHTPPQFSSLDPIIDTSYDFSLPPSAGGGAGFGEFDFFNNVGMSEKQHYNAQAGPSSMPMDVNIKVEPDMDFSWEKLDNQFSTGQDQTMGMGVGLGMGMGLNAPAPLEVPAIMPPAPALPTASSSTSTPPDLSSLPFDQQIALQQLMVNIIQYQQQFGFDLSAAAAVSPRPATTIDPSQVFSNTPATVPGLTGSSSSLISSALPTPSLVPSTSTSASASALPSVLLPPTVVASSADTASQDASAPAAPESNADDDDEELVSIDSYAQGQRPRSMSTFSLNSNVDERIDRLAPLSTIFSNGRGKGGKKGGGLSSVVRQQDEDVDDDDSWRPSAEEYKKLSSKEKRQLRNKLSARAFRNRRKDYIGTLEGHIKERDMVIDDIRAELADSKSENQNLRRELEALKQSTMNVIHPQSANETAEVPLMLSALSLPRTSTNGLSSGNKSVMSGMSSPLPRKLTTPTPQFNPRKDLPANGRSTGNMFGGPPTICHTILTPEGVPAIPLSSIASLPRQNLNPLLSAEDRPSAIPSGSNFNLQQSRPATGDAIGQSTFAQWTDENPFSLRSMDSYRMQMWSRLAREAQADKAGLVGEMRPKFFTDVGIPSRADDRTTTATATAVTGKASAADMAQAAQVAVLATSHITSKLASSFMAAFSGPGASSGAGGALDTDKLTAVVTGKARLKVVPNHGNAKEDDELLAALGGLRLQAGPGLAGVKSMNMSVGGTGGGARMDPLGVIGGFLRHAAAPTRA